MDLGLVSDDSGAPFPNLSNPSRGHQLMPSLSFNAGKLMLAYYDLRQDTLWNPHAITGPEKLR